MKNLINKKFLLALLIFLILTFLVSFLIWPRREAMPPSPYPTPSITEEKTEPPVSSDKKGSLTILRSEIPNRTIGLYERFAIEFSQIPSAANFSYEITPSAPVRVTLEGTTAYIGPRPTWSPNTEYKFTIKKDTKDIYGNLLEKDFVFTFKTALTRGI